MNYFGYIYKTTIPPTKNTPYFRYYYGQHRKSIFDKNYFGSGLIITRYIKKYGKSLLISEPIYWAKTKKDLDDFEKEIILKYLNDDNCINIRPGGNTSQFNPKSILKLKKSLEGKKLSLQHKSKIAKISSESFWITNGKIECFTREKNIPSDFSLGRLKWNQEKKDKRSKQYSGKNNPKAKKIKCINTGEIFECITDAAIKYGKGIRSSINACCIGTRKFAGKLNEQKLQWEYVNI